MHSPLYHQGVYGTCNAISTARCMRNFLVRTCQLPPPIKSDLESTALMHLRRDSITGDRYRREFPIRLVDFYFAQLVQSIIRNHSFKSGDVSHYLEQVHRNGYTMPSVDQLFEGEGDRGENEVLQELLTTFSRHVELHILYQKDPKTAWDAMTLFTDNEYPVQVIVAVDGESHAMSVRTMNSKYATLSNSHKNNPTTYLSKKDMNGDKFLISAFYSPSSPPTKDKFNNPIHGDKDMVEDSMYAIFKRLKADYSPSYESPRVNIKSPPPIGDSPDSPAKPIEKWIVGEPVKLLTDRKRGARCDPSLPHCYNQHEMPEMRDLVKQILKYVLEVEDSTCDKLLTDAETYIGRKLKSDDFFQLVEDQFTFIRNTKKRRNKKTIKRLPSKCSPHMTTAARTAIDMYLEGDRNFTPILEHIITRAEAHDLAKFRTVVDPDTKYILLRLLDYLRQEETSPDITELIRSSIRRRFSTR